jgi:O-acetyl-ADP-ribose deacetylase (regulator of RNase III)
VAAENGVRTIAFPAISCGVYGYPIDAAVEIALRETADAAMERVIFACFGDDVFHAYQRALARSGC